MLRRELIPSWVAIILVSGILLMGQNCRAQTNPCNPDPCPGIPKAVTGTCTPVGGSCTPANDFICECEVAFTWEDATNTCEGGLPDTGITLCYNNTTVIECPTVGQPFYGQDAQYVTNPMSYTVNGDGTVTDNVTGLMWQRQDDDMSRTWLDAISNCDALTLADYDDWRLPSEYELQSIVHYDRYNPTIDLAYFPGTESWYYWTSSPSAEDTGKAWCIEFSIGHVRFYDKTNAYYVRCVRGESIAQSLTDNLDGTVTDNATGLMWQKEDDNLTRSWESALAYCTDLDLGNHPDWRLPDVKELRSIVDNTRYNPAIDTAAFPGTELTEVYWSSSTYVSSAGGSAWDVVFTTGTVGSSTKTGPRYVRCVR